MYLPSTDRIIPILGHISQNLKSIDFRYLVATSKIYIIACSTYII